MTRDPLTVVLVFPELLGTYGDGGNALVLSRRAQWRGIASVVLRVSTDEPLPEHGDVYVLGGGEDSGQTLAAARLTRTRALPGAVGRGAAVLAVCAGLQLIGTSFEDGDGHRRAGVGIIDAVSRRRPGARMVGELLVEPTVAELPTVTGFENHRGLTVLGPGVRPLGRVRAGVGNGDGHDGVHQDRVVATYAHGPVLARNPALADLLLAHVVGHLDPLPDHAERALREARLDAVAGHPRHEGGLPNRVRARLRW